MRRWETPRAEVEEFMPNEYCSSCWGVACETNQANWYEKWHDSDLTHDKDHCGNPGNQVLRDLDKDGRADIMQEIGTDGLGTLNCQIYSDPGYKREKKVSEVYPGQRIYWTTSAKDGRTWHHQGDVLETYPGQPNRS